MAPTPLLVVRVRWRALVGKAQAGSSYLIDYDSITGRFSHYQEFNYDNRERGDLITHFEGIYRTDNGKYRLRATSVSFSGEEEFSIASVVTVKRKASKDFKAKAHWRDLDVVNSDTGVSSVLTTANSQYDNVTVGFANYLNGDGRGCGDHPRFFRSSHPFPSAHNRRRLRRAAAGLAERHYPGGGGL